MPDEWKSYRLEEVCDFINGFAFKSTDYVPPSNDTIEVLRMGYIERGGGFKEDGSPVFVPREYGRDLTKFFLQPGDIAIAMTDMKDRVAILGNTAWIREAGRFALNQRVGCIRVKRRDLVDARFLYFYSNWQPHVDYLRSRANSGVQVNLSTSAITQSEIPLPPLPEQQAIASVLGALDDKIELNRRTNETLEALARGLFKSWFVDATESAFPNGWCSAKWGDLVSLEYGKSLTNYDSDSDTYPVYGTNGLIGSHSTPLCNHPGIIIGRKGAYRGVHFCNSLFFVIDTAFYVEPKTQIELRWAYYELLRQDINGMDSGSAIPSTSRADFYNLPVLFPPFALQHRFVEALTPCWKKQEHNNTESHTLAALRDALLPKLLSGELRLPSQMLRQAGVPAAPKQVEATA